MRPELIVARKEFLDHLTSKRFLAIFAIMILLAILSMMSGLTQYNQTLQDYKDSAAQNQLTHQSGVSVALAMPSVLTVFSSMNQYLVLIAAILSVAMGFDLISKEKEEGSLKSLLSHPVYRDSVINGKLIGALSVLTVVMCSTFLITIAVMLFYGIVPTADDLIRIGAYFVMALLYCGVFFAISTMASTIAQTSAMAVLYTIAIVLVLYMITSFSGQVAGVIVGPAPQYVPMPAEDLSSSASSNSVPGADNAQQYYTTKSEIIDDINTLSPVYAFSDKISNAILYMAGAQAVTSGPSAYGGYTEPSILDSLSLVWTSVLAMIVELILPLAISYVIFLRMDIR
jgi:ABC-2 type transport system permease protein